MGDVIKIDNRLVKPVDLNFIMDNLKGVLRFYKSGVEKDLMIPVVQEREGNFLTLDGRHRFLARVLMEKQFGQAYLICGSGDTIEENLFPDKMHPMVREDIRHIVRARYNIVMPCYDSYIDMARKHKRKIKRLLEELDLSELIPQTVLGEIFN